MPPAKAGAAYHGRAASQKLALRARYWAFADASRRACCLKALVCHSAAHRLRFVSWAVPVPCFAAMSGANSTAPEAHSVHGTNPQFLVERITRDKIYAMTYWKEKCFGVSAAALVDLAMGIREFGGVYGGTQRCTDFICLLLKMLQIQPDKEIVVRLPGQPRCAVGVLRPRAQVEFIKNEEHKYVRMLGAFYLRMVGKPLEVYQYLEARS